MTKKIFLIACYLASLLAYAGCGGCFEPDTASTDYHLALVIDDAATNTQLVGFTGLYKTKDLKLLELDGTVIKRPYPSDFEENGLISYYFNQENVFDKDITKIVLLKFPDDTLTAEIGDIDTITIKYKLKEVDCIGGKYQKFSFSYNDSTYINGINPPTKIFRIKI